LQFPSLLQENDNYDFGTKCGVSLLLRCAR
jgi:hypothetical protein